MNIHLIAPPVSQRGVVFFRAQDNLTDALQKEFVHKLGLLSGKPKDSTLHIHPVLNNTNEFGVGDAEISTISSLSRKKMFKHELQSRKHRYDSAQWHSDIQFEPKPADYTSLRLTQLPSSGGDTLWASGYELYDRSVTLAGQASISKLLLTLPFQVLRAIPQIPRKPDSDIQWRSVHESCCGES